MKRSESESVKDVLRGAGVGKITKTHRAALGMTLTTREQKALVKKYGARKAWLVLYSHAHGDLGFKGGLTYAEAEAEVRTLTTAPNSGYLDFYKILLTHDEG